MHDDFEACYRALSSRDARFDGRFFTAVTSTGIYCRPVCPAQTPRRANVRFYGSAAAAEAAGFRACRRCRPQLAPGEAAAASNDSLAQRALRLLAAGEGDGGAGVAAVARRLEVSERRLHRILRATVGAGALTLARMRRLQAARILLEQTALSVTDVAFTSGYTSLRQFNSEVRSGLGCTPSDVRRRAPTRLDGDGAIVLRLGVRPPFDGPALLRFFALRAVAGVESVGRWSLTRSVRLARGAAIVEVEPHDSRVVVRLWLDDVRDLGQAVDACRRLVDVDADPAAIADVLGADPVLAPLVAAAPGLRVPGALGADEVAMRAVLGQQVSVGRATTLAARLTDLLGVPLARPRPGVDRLFPTAAAVAEADLGLLGLTGERAATLHRLAAALASGDVDLGPGADREGTRRQLLDIRGIGAWTAGYIAMRGLRDPDVLLAGDAAVRRALGRDDLTTRAERWRPWRSYATVHLWNSLSATTSTETRP